jgi:hypothetical protein
MTETSDRQTAKIYQFPPGGRAGLSLRRESSKLAGEPAPSASANKVAIGGSWYHEEAIQEVDPTRKH